MSKPLPPQSTLPGPAFEALQQDSTLPICVACGTQVSKFTESCNICEDPRQFVPSSGQRWTTLSDLHATHQNTLLQDKQDSRITFIQTEPPFAINQTPILIETAEGSWIWDCSALISPALVGYLLSLERPLKGIAISHPHFFSTSLTWSRVLNVPLYLNDADQTWFQRLDDIVASDQVEWWIGERVLAEGLKLVQCGGHFPGSSILHWDRLVEPPPPADNLPLKPTPVSGIIFCADTIMVQPTQKGFTFIWSVPNMIPLNPKSVIAIEKILLPLPFAQATSSWPNRFIRDDAKDAFRDSCWEYLQAMGWGRNVLGGLLAVDQDERVV